MGGGIHDTQAGDVSNEQDDDQTGSSYAADMEDKKQQDTHQDGSNQKGHMRAVIQTTDDTIAMDSLRSGQWVTCTVNDRNMS